MDKQTLEALENSICKWDLICQGVEEDKGANNCALCQLFYANNCFGCPVMDKTQIDGCVDSPYISFTRREKEIYFEFRQIEEIKPLHYFYCEEAEKELIFLINLLPEDHPWKEILL